MFTGGLEDLSLTILEIPSPSTMRMVKLWISILGAELDDRCVHSEQENKNEKTTK
jgi:hypothetical protein